ncbi:MAG: tRNA (adenosine(37)-N6)-dimethylallyltransferase MiaA [Bacteroidetes bacterium]|nr:MAG: tRNA (adenosine(37)-N6)-dimethylallyltransferase MiaA [Bacteroidota bacterium]
MEPQNKGHLIVLAGPTAVGKTSLAIDLAKHFDTEIISCDSRQIYKELNIGVARPSNEELNQVKHHFIATNSIHQDYDAGVYAKEVNGVLEELFKQHKTVIMTGGTGLYIRAATQGLDALPPKDEKVREQLNQILEAEGIEALQTIATSFELKPSSVDFTNPHRLIRSIEIVQGEPLIPETNQVVLNYDTTYFYVNRDRAELYDRINQRVDAMIQNGFEQEAKSVYPYRKLNALNTVGYKELFQYFDGEWTQSHAIDKMKQHTRNYAKRQLTWFRNQGSYTEISPNLDEILLRIKQEAN